MYVNGVKVSSIDSNKICLLEECSWHTCEEFGKNIPSNYTGYIKNNSVYDNCRSMYLKSLQKWDKSYFDKWTNYNKFKENLTMSINIFNTLLTNIKTKDNLISENNKYIKILKDGFKYKKIHGNKVKVGIDVVDIEKLTKKVEDLEKKISSANKKLITSDKDIYTVFKLTHTYDLKLVNSLNFAWNNYKETKSNWNKFQKLRSQIIEKFDNYEDVYTEFIEEINIREITNVKEKRNTRHKTKYYIDKNGNKVDLNDTIEQNIIHK